MDLRPYRIEPAKAWELIEAGQAVVLDLTSSFISAAVRGRIPGAQWISPRALLDRNRRSADIIRELGTEIPRDKTIIAYCTCPDEEASVRMSRALRQEGFDAWTLDGGLPAWRAAGFPMELKQAA